jgi:hypothetical protein
VSGTVSITGAPAGFKTEAVGVGACPVSATGTLACASPGFVLAANKKNYSLELGVGTWRVGAFYELRSFGGEFIGPSAAITVTMNAKDKKSFSIPYQVPATLTGTVQVSGVPSDFQIQNRSVILCPSYAPYRGGTGSIACVNASTPFNEAGLPPGRWTAIPSFCALSRVGGEYQEFQYQCFTNAKASKSITLSAGGVGTLDLTTPFLTPGYGMLAGAVSIDGAPKGFSDPVGVDACRNTVSSCQEIEVTAGKLFELLLPVGTWHINPFYLAAPFYNEITGPTKTVKITSGNGAVFNVSQQYKALGQAEGAVDVTGAPSGVSFHTYTVLACPSSSPWTGGAIPDACVSEYSGTPQSGGGIGIVIGSASSAVSKLPHPPVAHLKPADASAPSSYQLPTLTPGTWLLYPGYQTVFATYVDSTPTRVTVVSGNTTVQNLTVPYKTPLDGAVTGTVSVVGAPANGDTQVQLGVEACSTPPTSCIGGQTIFADQNGNYQLVLTPGTWSIRGIAQYFSYVGTGVDFETSRGAAQQITVQAGVQTSQDFTVNLSS